MNQQKLQELVVPICLELPIVFRICSIDEHDDDGDDENYDDNEDYDDDADADDDDYCYDIPWAPTNINETLSTFNHSTCQS